MSVRSMRFAALMLCSAVAAPAFADLPSPMDPSPPFAFSSASYDDGVQHVLPLLPIDDPLYSPFPVSDPAYVKYQSHFGEGTAAAGFTSNGVYTGYATATVSFAPDASIYVAATNPALDPATGYLGSHANAHGEVHYQYQVLIADPNNSYNPFDTYSDVVSVSGSSHISTNGPNTQVRIAASANVDLANSGLNFTTSYGDGSGGGVYLHNGIFSFGGAAQFVGDQQIGGIVYATFIGSITMQVDVFGTTHSAAYFDAHGQPQTTVVDYPGLGGEAYIDPSITVSHAFLQTHGASDGIVNLSPGIANSLPVISGTPEPDSWALLIAGFGLTGAALRRRKPVVA